MCRFPSSLRSPWVCNPLQINTQEWLCCLLQCCWSCLTSKSSPGDEVEQWLQVQVDQDLLGMGNMAQALLLCRAGLSLSCQWAPNREAEGTILNGGRVLSNFLQNVSYSSKMRRLENKGPPWPLNLFPEAAHTPAKHSKCLVRPEHAKSQFFATGLLPIISLCIH